MPFRPHRYYKLDGRRVVTCQHLLEWAQWFETAERHVADDLIEGYRVSTVFLGMDHSFAPGDGPPVLFETMIFAPVGDHEAMDRYCTWEEAEAGHARMLQGLREELQNAADQAEVALSVIAQRLRAI